MSIIWKHKDVLMYRGQMLFETLIFLLCLTAIRSLLRLLMRQPKLAKDDGIVWTDATSYMYSFNSKKRTLANKNWKTQASKKGKE